MISYRDAIRMRKKADFFDSALSALGGVVNLGGTLPAAAIYTLLAATVPLGVATGWVGAKMTSADKTDEDDVQLQYDAQRMKSDIGYLKARLREESAPLMKGDAGQQPKSVRMV